MTLLIPDKAKYIINKLYQNKFEGFLVGGCVRDSLLGLIPKDFDIATSALPGTIIDLFPKTIPTGLQHGTITVMIDKEAFEVTTYRTDGTYSDNRRPEDVEFVTNITEDLSRRDFTINALAYNDKVGLIDKFNGQNDLKNRVIRCVGDPNLRFNEDALRMLRAIRFSCQLNFDIESDTFNAIKSNYTLISKISVERIRDELCKILISNNPAKGIELLQETGVLSIVLPTINNLVGYTPNCTNHNRDVFKHTLKVLSNTPNDLLLRLAALFHDIGKLETMSFLENGHCYFPDHQINSSITTERILKNLHFDNLTISRVTTLILNHMVFDVNIMPSRYEAKKLLTSVGEENIFLLFALQRSDITALWDPEPFLKKVDYTSDLILDILEAKDPLRIKDLKIDGRLLISYFNLKPGKKLGLILNYLLEEVLKDPANNSKDSLLNLANNYIMNT